MRQARARAARLWLAPALCLALLLLLRLRIHGVQERLQLVGLVDAMLHLRAAGSLQKSRHRATHSFILLSRSIAIGLLPVKYCWRHPPNQCFRQIAFTSVLQKEGSRPRCDVRARGCQIVHLKHAELMLAISKHLGCKLHFNPTRGRIPGPWRDCAPAWTAPPCPASAWCCPSFCSGSARAQGRRSWAQTGHRKRGQLSCTVSSTRMVSELHAQLYLSALYYYDAQTLAGTYLKARDPLSTEA